MNIFINFRFCGKCSALIRLESRYCWKCKTDQTEVGHPRWTTTSVHSGSESNSASCSSSSETSSGASSGNSFGRPKSGFAMTKKIMSFDDFIKNKTSKRNSACGFEATKKKKAKTKNPDVTINIGLKKFVDGDFKTIWGKKLPISVPRNATYALILERAVEKWTAFDRKFNSEDSYALIYEDGSHARFLPGSSKHFFDLEMYKTELGKDFKRITLYLCTSFDLDMCLNPSKDDDREAKYEDDTEVVWEELDHMLDTETGVSSDVSVKVMQQIEEDKQIAQIIQDQLCDDQFCEMGVKCTDDVYKIAKSKVDADQQFKITIRRNAPLSRRLLLWQRETKKSSPTSQVNVHFIAEDGIDSGALRKEFLENTMQEIKTVMFPNGNPIHSTYHVQNGNFRTCGEIVAASIAQDGPAPCFFEPCAFDAIWKDVDLLNIRDEHLTAEEHIILHNIREDCTKHLDFIVENGYSGQVTNDHIEEIISSIKVSFVSRRSLYMNEFKVGLNTYGLGDLISSHPDICKKLFLQNYYAETVPDGNYLISLLKPRYSPEATSKRLVEESLMDHMQDLLISFEDKKVTGMSAPVAWKDDDAEVGETENTDTEEVLETADLSVAGIMGWLTGQKHKQSYGAKPTITVHFDHECLKRNPKHTVCYPLVGACGRDLTLPVAHMQTKEKFEEIFVTGFCMGQAAAKP